MKKKKNRRDFEVFSMSFLDCICCGFGAMLLLFVLTIGKNANQRDSVVSEIKVIISDLERDIPVEEQLLGNIRMRLKIEHEAVTTTVETLEAKKSNMTELEEQLALILQEQSVIEDEIAKLIDEKEAIPTQDEAVPIPIPNVQRRQYLSGFNLEGDNVVFLIEASGGMLGNTVEEALESIELKDEEKRKVVKWRRVIRSIQWIIANLTPSQRYQIMVFNEEPVLLIPESVGTWLDPMDREGTILILKKLAEITPEGGANLERAFNHALVEFLGMDTIVLLADGLPTQSDSIPVGSSTDDLQRERLFRVATRSLPKDIPVNTILYPMSGDPAAPFLFWQLAQSSRGALISPAPSWPDL